MKPEGITDKIQIRLWENNAGKTIVEENDKFLIQDTEDKKRQLFFKNNFNVLLGEARIKLSSKTNIAKPGKGVVYYPVETLDKYKENRVVQCLDEAFVHGFYEQSLLCTMFYMDISKLPKNSFKIIDIGAGLGSLSFNFYRLFKGACEIYNIEKNKEMYEIGMKYFGYKNYDNENKVTWIFEDGKSCIEKMAKFEEINTNKTKKLEKKYKNKLNYCDLIFNEIDVINPKESTVPSKDFFENAFLENIKTLLKPFGIYIVKLMAGNYKSFYDCYLQLEKNFASIFTIPSEGALTSIFFCFKDKIEIKEYQEKFKANKETAEKSNFIDFSVINYFYKGILVKLEDMSEQRKIIEENAKKI
jgi:spermidine synthase